VIRRNENRSDKSLWTENGEGCKVKLYAAEDEGDEARFVASEAKRSAGDGIPFGAFAVLYRNNSQSRAVEDTFVMAGVPYRLFGGVRFYERMEVKDVLSYLKAIHNPSDDLAYSRVINVPRRGIGDTTIARIRAYAAETGQPFSAAIRDAETVPELRGRSERLLRFAEWMEGCAAFAETNPVSELIHKVLDETEYINYLTDGTIEGEGRAENARELLSKAVEFEKSSDSKSLGAFLEDVALVADVDAYDENVDAVSLMTLHSAKGLEFDRVFIVGAEENIFPSARSLGGSDPDALEEERRLCYVGFTRARKELYVTRAKRRMQYGAFVSNAESRFLGEIPAELVETMRKGKRTAERQAKAARPPEFKNPYVMPKIPQAKPFNEKPSWDSAPQTVSEYRVGERVRQSSYGVGRIIAVRDRNGEQEVSVAFEGAGIKKFMAGLAKLERMDAEARGAANGSGPGDG
jgi:DNA helicase-2/ATP-dependent DNA helicase PcrA